MIENAHPDDLLLQYLRALTERSSNIEEEDIDVYCNFYNEIRELLKRYAEENQHRFIKEKLEEFPSISPEKYRKPLPARSNVFALVKWYYRMNKLKGDTMTIAGICNSIVTVLNTPVWEEMINKK